MNTPSSRNTLIAVGVVAALGVSAGALAQSTESSQPKARSETMCATSADYADAMRSYERQEYRQALQMFRAPVGNAFEPDLELASYQRPGSIELGLYQGDQPGAGYRLVYITPAPTGAQPGAARRPERSVPAGTVEGIP